VKTISTPSITNSSLGIRLRRRAIYTASKPSSPLVTLAIAGMVIAALWFARDIFIPLALAVLLSFALGPLVNRLRRLHVGHAPAVVAVVLFAFVVIAGTGILIGTQLTQLADELPRYQFNIIEKIHSIKGLGTGTGVVGRTSALLNELGTELAKSAPAAKTATPDGFGHAAAHSGETPLPLLVELHEPAATPFAIILNIFEPLLQPFATAGIVTVFVIFFLLRREQLRDRFIRLVGSGDLRHTTEALDDAFSRLGRYLLTQTMINAIFGLIIGTGLWLIGIPNPVLWGALGTLLRFVPYIGAIIAAVFPAILALAIDPGWTILLWTAGLFLSVEAIISQLIEPYSYGRSTGLSAVAVVIATTFWTWLWGPIGLLLSMPLTLCLIVLGRHVAALEFLDILLGDEPALTAEEKFYQRMLAGDSDEAAYQAEEYLKTNTLASYYDAIAVKGLGLAQLDVNRGELEHERRVGIKQAVGAVIDDLSEHAVPEAAPHDATGAKSDDPVANRSGTGWEGSAVLCVAGRGSLDEAVAEMLAQVLTKEGIGIRVVASSAVATANLAQLDIAGVRMICLSYLEPGDFTNARYLVRRLRRRLPKAEIVAGFWTLSATEASERGAARETTADVVVTSLQQAVEYVTGSAKGQPRQPEIMPMAALSAFG
jgi:predicted PurR-regulated permease PerM